MFGFSRLALKICNKLWVACVVSVSFDERIRIAGLLFASNFTAFITADAAWRAASTVALR